MSTNANAVPEPEFLSMVAKYLRSLGTPADLTMQSNLFDLGLDSTAALNLLLEIEERYGVVFPDALMDDATFATPAALKSSLQSLLG
jgi:acyl carrier protein